MAEKTFTNRILVSKHGTGVAAGAEAARRNGFTNDKPYRVEHVGSRQFEVVRTEVLHSEPQQVRHILDGKLIQCKNCNSHHWYYTGRDLFTLHYECVSCGNTITPLSETGACT
jgi:DNA-directed RNA polymerase subunit M/transcription elongation factor TFIIS